MGEQLAEVEQALARARARFDSGPSRSLRAIRIEAALGVAGPSSSVTSAILRAIARAAPVAAACPHRERAVLRATRRRTRARCAARAARAFPSGDGTQMCAPQSCQRAEHAVEEPELEAGSEAHRARAEPRRERDRGRARSQLCTSRQPTGAGNSARTRSPHAPRACSTSRRSTYAIGAPSEPSTAPIVAAPRGFWLPGLNAMSSSSIAANSPASALTSACVDRRHGACTGADEHAARREPPRRAPDAGDERAGVREVDVVHAALDAGARDAIVPALKRARRMDRERVALDRARQARCVVRSTRTKPAPISCAKAAPRPTSRPLTPTAISPFVASALRRRDRRISLCRRAPARASSQASFGEQARVRHATEHEKTPKGWSDDEPIGEWTAVAPRQREIEAVDDHGSSPFSTNSCRCSKRANGPSTWRSAKRSGGSNATCSSSMR